MRVWQEWRAQKMKPGETWRGRVRRREITETEEGAKG